MAQQQSRRFYQIMRRMTIFLVVWLSTLLILSITELQSLAFKTGRMNIFNTYSFVVLQLPLQMLVLFGCYALCSIGYHLMVLQDCGEAHAELTKEVEEAQSSLRKMGVNLYAGLPTPKK